MRLAGGPDGSASSVWLDADGNLKVEYYDFSSEAHAFFGNDIAYVLTIGRKGKSRVLDLLAPGCDPLAADADARLLSLLAGRFDGYFELKKWLEENGVPFEKFVDTWA